MKILKKTDLVLLISVLAAAAVFLLLWRYIQNRSGEEETQRYVVIEAAGEEIARLPLNENTTYAVEREGMRNVIVIEDGSVYMSEADCPNQNCVRQGRISEVGVPIVCLPHQVIVMIVTEQ
ncbi:MAG: NusG domain II-containing protein [Lachnospiraceae bacterium]|nr:NusG domain II-containing protein [Lachnospiraceae bacterium]